MRVVTTAPQHKSEQLLVSLSEEKLKLEKITCGVTVTALFRGAPSTQRQPRCGVGETGNAPRTPAFYPHPLGRAVPPGWAQQCILLSRPARPISFTPPGRQPKHTAVHDTRPHHRRSSEYSSIQGCNCRRRGRQHTATPLILDDYGTAMAMDVMGRVLEHSGVSRIFLVTFSDDKIPPPPPSPAAAPRPLRR